MYRRQSPPPPGEDWIDQRDVPEFPTVYGPMEYVCSYNPDIEKCKNFTPTPREGKRPPNVVFIIIESFSPSPLMINSDVITSNESVFKGAMYKSEYLPEMTSIANDSLQYVAMSSHGLPTIYGWFSLLTGEIPDAETYNMVQSIKNHVDDFPSYFQ